MKRRQTVISAAAVTGMVLCSTVWAQPAQPSRTADSPRNAVVSSFERAAPQVGELIPDVSGFDADGKPFRLRDLRGKYTVLVFGCLT